MSVAYINEPTAKGRWSDNGAQKILTYDGHELAILAGIS